MRSFAVSGATTALTAAVLLFAPALQAHATPGDNGTVKIHDAATGDELRKNEPHVCTFYLDAFGFDGDQQVQWHIETWAPTATAKGRTVKAGSLALDGTGHGRTADLGLPDGHYKLFWNFDGEHGRAKQKVFWTECDGSQGGTQSGGTSQTSPTPSPASSASPSSPTAEPAGADTAPSPSGKGEGDLAETGSSGPVVALAGGAALLLAAGGGLVMFRRRQARQH